MGQPQNLAQRLSFTAKASVLRLLRAARNRRDSLPKWPIASNPPAGIRHEIRTLLFVDPRPEEQFFELGKIANLRNATRFLHNVEVPAGGIFSFWRQVGCPSTRRGFVPGRMLQSGCVVPSVAGGLCQLSNSLYELALRTGCEIVERHAHSIRLTGTPLRDATLAWNYIDLRFRPKTPLRLDLRMTATELVVAFHCKEAAPTTVPLPIFASGQLPLADTCATCSETDCSRHQTEPPQATRTQGFLVDAVSPEFDRYLQSVRGPGDVLILPLEGRRWRLPQYAWSTAGFDRVHSMPFSTLLRSRKLRRLATQGAARQTKLLETSSQLASRMVPRIPPLANHLIVDQTLLPALWRSGALGGRTFDVLMRRLPMRAIHSTMDRVAERHPESPTAADFRAPDALVAIEEQALACARRLITPNRFLASQFPSQSEILDWIPPTAPTFKLQQGEPVHRIFLPGPVTARKGAYVLREALASLRNELPFELLWRGSPLEGTDFWQGLPARRANPVELPISVVVQPSFLEDQPRTLLRALACGIPVIATPEAGPAPHPNLTVVPSGDAPALREALVAALARNHAEP